MEEYDSSPVLTFTGHATINADLDPATAVACQPIPVPAEESTGCRESTPFYCVDKRTNPATTSCTTMRFVFARHYIRNGQARPGLNGAYLPANTICHSHVSPVPITRLKDQPNAAHYGLPEGIG